MLYYAELLNKVSTVNVFTYLLYLFQNMYTSYYTNYFFVDVSNPYTVCKKRSLHMLLHRLTFSERLFSISNESIADFETESKSPSE